MFRENKATIKNVNIFILHNATVVDLVANASFIFVEGEGETFCLWVLQLEWECTSCLRVYSTVSSSHHFKVLGFTRRRRFYKTT